MLRITPMGANSKSYLRDGLSKADYYTNGEPILETWKGELAMEIGLESQRATIENFDNLCDNINPQTGKMLSAKNAPNRKAYYDFTFSSPKSVSLLHTLTSDQKLKNEIEKAMKESVIETMKFAESEFTLTRDKTNGQNRYLKTGKLLYTDFLHDTSRPVGGIPDPHLHIHVAVFNITKDPETKVFKAVEFHDFAKYRNQIEAVHHSVLASKLKNLGFELYTTHNSFEIQKIDRKLIEDFSNATKKIEKFAEDKGITSSTTKGNLGAKLREKKTDKIPHHELVNIWFDRLAKGEKEIIQSFTKAELQKNKILKLQDNTSSKSTIEAINKSINHHFQNNTTADKRNVITFALNSDLTTLDYQSILKAYETEKIGFEIVDTIKGRQTFLTTKSILKEENRIKDFVNSNINNTTPINNQFKLENSMSADQDRVFYSVLNSKDSIQYIRGDAGTGKTYLIQNLKNAMQESNLDVFAYAPTSIAGRKVLREEVSKDSNTIQALISNPKEQEKLNSKSVVFIDEAGLLSYSDMIKLFELKENKSFRLLLVGDTKQHAPVARGDALRYIETHTNIKTLALTNNRRQNDPQYKKAIKQLANKDVNSAIQTLDNIGAIKEIPLSTKRYEAISKEYINKVKTYRTWKEAQKEVLIVTPTHEEASIITNKVRKELKKNGYIRASEYAVDIDRKTYHPYLKDTNRLTNKPLKKEIPFQSADKFSVLKEQEIKLSIGDLVRVSNSVKTGDKTMLKGSILSIKDINQNKITLDNNQTLPSNFRHLKHGYTSTSYSSQGRTVTNLIIAQSTVSLPASSFEQGYVSASRGKASISIYTDNKPELVKAIGKSKVREFGAGLTTYKKYELTK